ncbi:MAG: hypothetical protein ACR2NP_23290 [Pirellulaceae bacterium]
MKILFLHGFGSRPGGIKPAYLARHGHEVSNPQLSDVDFLESIRIAEAEYERFRPDVIAGSSRGGGVAVNMQSRDTPLVLLCPSWKNKQMASTVKPNILILHSREDELIPFSDSEELLVNSGLSPELLIETGFEHRLADEETLRAMLRACEQLAGDGQLNEP